MKGPEMENIVSPAPDKTTQRIHDMVDRVFVKYHREMNYAEFEPLMIESYRFFSNVLTLSLMNYDAVSKERFPKLICDMETFEEYNDFLFYVDVEQKKKELNDHHK